MKYRLILRIAWFSFLCAVVIGSLLPSDSPPMQMLDRLEVSDLILHSLGYLLLTTFSILNFSPPRTVWSIIPAVFLLSFLIECGQRFVPGRTFDIRDLAANLTGAMTAGLGWRLIRGILR